MTKYVYLFREGNAGMRNLLGGKGANLAEMTNIGMPVPQGFTVTTEACTRYYADKKTIAPEIEQQIYDALAVTEKEAGKKFGDLDNPFLVSVRSGSRASMPGMMDTILNLGMNDVSVKGLAKLTGNERFAYDSYRRFIQMFSDVVMEVEKKKFEAVLDGVKSEKGVKGDTDLSAEDLKEVVKRYLALVYGHLEPVTASDPQSHTYLPEVAANAWDAGLPRYLVPLCQDGRDYYAVDPEGEVFLWREETGEVDEGETWESVWHWVRDVWLEGEA